MEKKELDDISRKYELLMKRFYSGTVKYRMRTGDLVLKNLVKKESGESLPYTGSFNTQLTNIKQYLKEGIARFQKQYSKNEELQEEVLYFYEKIDDAQCSEDIINIIVSLYENDNFKIV